MSFASPHTYGRGGVAVQDAVAILIEHCGNQFAFEGSCDVETRLNENEAEGARANSFLALERLMLSHIVSKDQTQDWKR
jgi:hypothetical protein